MLSPIFVRKLRNCLRFNAIYYNTYLTLSIEEYDFSKAPYANRLKKQITSLLKSIPCIALCIELCREF